jgi:hypothetical protein
MAEGGGALARMDGNRCTIKWQYYVFSQITEKKVLTAPRLILTANLSCGIIVDVEIEETCPLVKIGRDHKGRGKFQQIKNKSLPY